MSFGEWLEKQFDDTSWIQIFPIKEHLEKIKIISKQEIISERLNYPEKIKQRLYAKQRCLKGNNSFKCHNSMPRSGTRNHTNLRGCDEE